MHRAPPEPTWYRLRARIRGRSQGARFSVAVSRVPQARRAGASAVVVGARLQPVNQRKALAPVMAEFDYSVSAQLFPSRNRKHNNQSLRKAANRVPGDRYCGTGLHRLRGTLISIAAGLGRGPFSMEGRGQNSVAVQRALGRVAYIALRQP